jgi:hypothetical protein
MTAIMAPMCMSCARFNRDPDATKLNCEAYPAVIPDEIIMSQVDHRKPYKGDRGIQFEQDQKLPVPLVFSYIFDPGPDNLVERYEKSQENSSQDDDTEEDDDDQPLTTSKSSEINTEVVDEPISPVVLEREVAGAYRLASLGNTMEAAEKVQAVARILYRQNEDSQEFSEFDTHLMKQMEKLVGQPVSSIAALSLNRLQSAIAKNIHGREYQPIKKRI